MPRLAMWSTLSEQKHIGGLVGINPHITPQIMLLLGSMRVRRIRIDESNPKGFSLRDSDDYPWRYHHICVLLLLVDLRYLHLN